VFVRDAYLQRRLYLVFDGNPPQSKLSGDEDWEAEALKESEEPAADEGDAATPPTDEEGPTPKQ
jgi:phospholipid-binding lipoprotein MlaA